MKSEIVKDELVVDLFPERVFTEDEYSRLVEFLDDLMEVINVRDFIGRESSDDIITEMHYRIEVLESEMELDLIHVAKGYLGEDGYRFAKGILKDMLEAKNEKGVQELYSAIEVR